MTIHNAIIKSTMLGIEDHGILSFMLNLEFEASSIGYGGYVLDRRIPETGERVPVGGGVGITMIRKILETVGVMKWEDLSGKYVRINLLGPHHDKITQLGHIVKDDWVSLGNINSESLKQ